MGTRTLPTRILPEPSSASPALCAGTAAELDEVAALLLRAPDEDRHWPAYVAELEVDEPKLLADLLNSYPCDIEPDVIGEVPVHRVSVPRETASGYDRMLMHTHGGAYILGGGRAGLREAVLAAHRTHSTVVSVDYRMPPRHPFPAAVEDCLSVWEGLLGENPGRSMAIVGTSTGGALAVATSVLALRRGRESPGALIAATPWSDLTETGDSYQANRFIDGNVPFYEGLLEKAALAYARGNLTDPLASPVYADLAGLPPTMLTTGTRDLFLSCTARLHRALRAAGVTAELHVFEGVSHGDLIRLYEAPESIEAYREAALFLDRHLL